MPDRNEHSQFSLKFVSANQTTVKRELRFKSFENDVCFSVFGARARVLKSNAVLLTRAQQQQQRFSTDKKATKGRTNTEGKKTNRNEKEKHLQSKEQTL